MMTIGSQVFVVDQRFYKTDIVGFKTKSRPGGGGGPPPYHYYVESHGLLGVRTRVSGGVTFVLFIMTLVVSPVFTHLKSSHLL